LMARPAEKEIGNIGEVECGSRSPPHRGHGLKVNEGVGQMTNGFRGWSVKDWTAADDERLRDLSLKGMNAREIGIELKRTATAVRSRSFRMNLLERKPVIFEKWGMGMGTQARPQGEGRNSVERHSNATSMRTGLDRVGVAVFSIIFIPACRKERLLPLSL
jgi:hypothetical protein